MNLNFALIFAFSLWTLTLGANPVFPGWYADPEGIIYGQHYWIFPTYSAPFGEQTYFDAYSSFDLVNWFRYPRVIDNTGVTWVRGGLWAPSVLEKDDRYYLLFGANNVHEGELGGIGIAVADRPWGPYIDLIGRPLINDIVNGAQPIDQFVFKDVDGTYYMYYGGWGRCNMVKLSPTLTHLLPFDDGLFYHEITPQDYTEGPFMFVRNGTYYFMWSEGTWTGPDYRVAYSMSSTPFGPFERIDTILQQDPEIATGAGHHSVMQVPGTDTYYIVYHRRPLGETDENHRVTCIEEMKFAPDGKILPVTLTNEGVVGIPIRNVA